MAKHTLHKNTVYIWQKILKTDFWKWNKACGGMNSWTPLRDSSIGISYSLESPLISANMSNAYKRGKNRQGSCSVTSLPFTGLGQNCRRAEGPLPAWAPNAGRQAVASKTPWGNQRWDWLTWLLWGPVCPHFLTHTHTHTPAPGVKATGEQCEQHMPGRLWSLGPCPGQGHTSMISAEPLEGKSAEGILRRSETAQSLEVWIQKDSDRKSVV